MVKTKSIILQGSFENITKAIAHHLNIMHVEDLLFNFSETDFRKSNSEQIAFALEWACFGFDDFGEIILRDINKNRTGITIVDPFWMDDYEKPDYDAPEPPVSDEFLEERNLMISKRDEIVEDFLERLKKDGYIEHSFLDRDDVYSDDMYIDQGRIEELKITKSEQWDTLRLEELCRELNTCYSTESYLAVVMLLRTILNHIPPIFGHKIFSEFANNYGGKRNNKSFKKSMQNLDKSLKNIADRHLHQPIRQKESLPTRTQVDFRQDLDVLLEEVVRVLKE